MTLKAEDNTSQADKVMAAGLPPSPYPASSSPAPSTSKPRLKRLASKPLKPLKLAGSAVYSVATFPARMGSTGGTGTPSAVDDEDPLAPASTSTTSRPGTCSTASTLLEPPNEVTAAASAKKRGFTRRRRHHQNVGGSMILDASQVVATARGPRKPLEGEEPAATLRVRVVSAEGLVAKDRNGLSDPYVSVLMPPQTRFTTSVIKRSLNPTWPAAGSTFDFPIYLSLAGVIGGRGLEAVMWDKDMIGKEYMGELFVGVDQWFAGGSAQLWDEGLKPNSFELVSTRRKQKVSGSVQLQMGFLSPPGAANAADALAKVRKVFDTVLSRAFLGNQSGVLGVPAYEGIGTVVMTDDDQHTTKSGFSVLTSALVAPLVGPPQDTSLEQYYLNDGLSSSDEDEMEDALQGDDDGLLHESPANMLDASPLDEAGVQLIDQKLAETKLHPDQPTLSSSPRKPWSRRSSGGESSTPTTPGIPGTPGTVAKKRKTIFRRGKSARSRQFNLGDNKGVRGIVVMEINGAEDLPKIKNAIKLGWDMDPFVVVSFGKKVFRTRVIRHSLNPTWNEKLVFHVHEHEEQFTVQMAVLDWDKISGNDMVGTCTLPLQELMQDAPQPDSVSGLYGKGVDGKHETKEFSLPITTQKSSPWESRHAPMLKIRAKYEPYDALRQRFWRQYAMQYDSDDTGAISYLELSSMLDSLGSTLTNKTIEGYFAKFGKSADKDELTFDEVVQCLEGEVSKTRDQKRHLSDAVDPTELSNRLLDSNWPRDINGGGGSDYSSEKNGTDAAATGSDSTPAFRSNTVPALKVESYSAVSSSPVSSDVEDSEVPGMSVERVINIKECPLCHRPRMGKRSEQDMVTHLAICASVDWSRVDRIVSASYVTPSQAQRKLVSKIINKVAVGQYSLGANSANILVQDRLTGQLQEEKMAVYVRIGIRVLYKGARTQMAGARARKLLKSMSVKQGTKYNSPSSAADIMPFIAFHNLNVAEIRDPLSSFKTFNEFFYRKLKPEARPLDEPDNPYRLVSAADCRMMAFDTVSDATQIWIKGRDFSVARLLGPAYRSQWDNYDGGALAIFRLAPQDYHRFHSPVRGRIGKMTMIDGEYYTVNPQAIRTALDVYGENVRKIVPIESEEFGTVMTVWVGAMMVGSIGTSVEEGQMVDRGDELGWFAFGGSTIVCIFEKGRAVWDEDIQANGAAAIETLVRMGMGIGRAPQNVSRRGSAATP